MLGAVADSGGRARVGDHRAPDGEDSGFLGANAVALDVGLGEAKVLGLFAVHRRVVDRHETEETGGFEGEEDPGDLHGGIVDVSRGLDVEGDLGLVDEAGVLRVGGEEDVSTVPPGGTESGEISDLQHRFTDAGGGGQVGGVDVDVVTEDPHVVEGGEVDLGLGEIVHGDDGVFDGLSALFRGRLGEATKDFGEGCLVVLVEVVDVASLVEDDVVDDGDRARGGGGDVGGHCWV